MIDNTDEGLPADVPLADAGVTILMAAAIIQTVVQVNGFQTISDRSLCQIL